jgi:soluble lytic murein transglycosylase-like protein
VTPAFTRRHRVRGSALALLALVLALPAAASPMREPADPVLVERLAASLADQTQVGDRFDAEVWLRASDQRLTRYLADTEYRLELLRIVYREAHRQNLDADLVLAVMQIESAFDRFAISRVGAQGLMQVMPFWREEIGRPQDNLTEVETNIRYGTTILAHYLEVSNGDLVDALARYNGSRGRLKYPELVMTAWRRVWRNKTAAELPELTDSCRNYGLRACRYL